MTITLRPEQQELIEQAIERGAYRDPEEMIARALEVLQAEDWLNEQKEQIHDKIERSFAQFERGEFFTPEQSMADLARHKAAWLAARK